MNVSQRYPDTEVLPIPSVHCFASTLPAQSELSSIFDLMEMSPQHRGMQGLSLRRKTDTGVRRRAIWRSLAFLRSSSLTGAS
jgi:hypothetical protein